VTKRFLSDRSIYISPAQSVAIRNALRRIGVIDAQGFIKFDPRKDQPRTQWTAKLAKVLPWLKRTSPYYNLISDESQIWQGGWGSSWLACNAPPHAACMAMLASARPGRVRLPAPECLVACVAPGSRRAHASRAPAPHTCTHACPAELNVAYSQHEIVSDYVRPTLMWLERGGKGTTLNSLVKRFSLNNRITCLTERYEGCRT
jgi:hypothetical protein